MRVTDLIRPDLLDVTAYPDTVPAAARVLLHANESPWPSSADPEGTARCYPPVRSRELATAMARWQGVEDGWALPARGADEAIDLVVRACCRPGGDAILVTPPTFGMYAVTARLHGTAVVEVPGLPDAGQVLAAAGPEVRVIFLCSPGNPTGELVPLETVRAVARGTHALVVADEAYLEYTDAPSAVTLLRDEGLVNVAVLRTLSKAHALAGARAGCVVAAPELIAVMTAVQPPYALPSRSIELALAALEPQALARTAERVARTREQRARLARALGVAEGHGNFVWVPARPGLEETLAEAGIAVAARPEGLRISVGSPDEVDRLLDAVS